MGVVVGLMCGIGLLLVWSAFTMPPTPRADRRPSRLTVLLGQAGVAEVSAGAVTALCFLLAAIVFLLINAVSSTWPVALAFATIAGYLPVAVLRQRADRRRREFAEVWPDAVDNLSSAVRAGMSLPDALSALGTQGPEVLQPSFARFAVDYQVTGRFSDSLDRLKEALADPVGDRVVEGLRVAREVGGGDLGRLLRSMSTHLRDDARTRSELLARQAWSVNGARLAVAAPWAVLLLMSFQTEVIQRYSSPAGIMVLLIGAGLCASAYWLMMRIGRLPSERRILQ